MSTTIDSSEVLTIERELFVRNCFEIFESNIKSSAYDWHLLKMITNSTDDNENPFIVCYKPLT